MVVKNNKQVVILMMMMVITLCFTGCIGNSKKELANKYMEQVKPILSEVTSIGKDWDIMRSDSANGTISNSEVYSMIEDEFMPRSREVQYQMEDLKVDKALRDVHEIGIKMILRDQEAYTWILSYIKTGDVSKLTTANRLLEESRELERRYIDQLEKMSK